jgi:xanthine/uracil/vitamin C permease (AzgA family)
MSAWERFFHLEQRGSTVWREVIAGLTTFTTMSYNIAVGISAGFVLYPLCKLVAGKIGGSGLRFFALTALPLPFFVFYP